MQRGLSIIDGSSGCQDGHWFIKGKEMCVEGRDNSFQKGSRINLSYIFL